LVGTTALLSSPTENEGTPTKAEARLAIFTWIEAWYNPLRRHSGLGQRSPNKFERNLHIEKLNTDIIEADGLVQEGQSVR